MNCAKCGKDVPVDDKFCRNCGNQTGQTVDPGAATTPISAPAMSKEDILIKIKSVLRPRAREGVFHITFSDIDREVGLPAGTTKKHIDEAAGALKIRIISKGELLAELQQEIIPALPLVAPWIPEKF